MIIKCSTIHNFLAVRIIYKTKQKRTKNKTILTFYKNKGDAWIFDDQPISIKLQVNISWVCCKMIKYGFQRGLTDTVFCNAKLVSAEEIAENISNKIT